MDAKPAPTDRQHAADLERLGLAGIDQVADEAEAPKPLPDPLLPVLAVPRGALPENWETHVDDVAERSNCPPDYVLLPLIVAAGMMIGRHCGVRPKRRDSWTATPNVWGLIVGPPGTLKSPALKSGLAPLDRFEQEARAAFLASRQEFAVEEAAAKIRADEGERQARKILSKDAGADIRHLIEAEPVSPPVEERFLVSDATVEKLGEILQSNPGGVCYVRDEAYSLLSMLGREEQATARGFLLTGWDGGRYRVDRIGRGTVDIPNARVSLVGGIQPGPLASLVRSATGSGDDGLIQRPLYVWPDLSAVEWKDVDRYPNRAARNAVLESFERLRNPPADLQQDTFPDGQADGLPYLRLDDEALEAFLCWRADLEAKLSDPDTPDGLRAALSKYRKHTPALALIIHCIDEGRGPVSARSMVKALALSDYFESHTRRVFDSGRRPVVEAAQRILRRLSRGDLKAGGFTLRETMRPQWSGLTDRAVVSDALAMLVDYRHLSAFTVETGGRPSEVFLWRGAP